RLPANHNGSRGRASTSAVRRWRLLRWAMRLHVLVRVSLSFASVAVASIAMPAPATASDVQIPFTKTTLPNGMVVILSEDHAVPQVVVNVTYGVGSRMERAGRTGFAHLFEHLMFMGTRRAPTTAIPLLLWLEADRMRDLGPLIDQSKLDLQRDVVRNERRQSIENRPY